MTTQDYGDLSTTMTAEELVAAYGDLSSADLAKQINDDYSVILSSERANLPRALAMAPKLSVLRTRAWGQWKTKFPSYGLTISYETASVYLRIWEHWTKIQQLATAKGVDPTLLTIDGARELWANRNKADDATDADTDVENADDDAAGDGKPTPEAMEARQAANAEAEAAELAADDDDVEGWFEQAVKVFSQDELRELTERLAKHLGMRLTPIGPLEARALDAAGATNRMDTSTGTAGFERRI